MKLMSLIFFVATLLFEIFLFQNTSFAQDEYKKKEIASLNIIAQGVDESIAHSLSQILASRLGDNENFKVISVTEIQAMLGFEYEKQALGCSEDIICLAEIGGALGVDYLVTGTLGKLNDTFVLNLVIIDIVKAEVLRRFSETWEGKSSKLVELLSPGVAFLLNGEKSNKYMGKIDILVNEQGALIRIDDKEIGKSPVKKQCLPIGKHSIQITKPGYSEFLKHIIVKKDQSSAVMANLITLSEAKPFYKKWWFWTIIGTTIAGTTAAIFSNFDNAEEKSKGIIFSFPSP